MNNVKFNIKNNSSRGHHAVCKGKQSAHAKRSIVMIAEDISIKK